MSILFWCSFEVFCFTYSVTALDTNDNMNLFLIRRNKIKPSFIIPDYQKKITPRISIHPVIFHILITRKSYKYFIIKLRISAYNLWRRVHIWLFRKAGNKQSLFKNTLSRFMNTNNLFLLKFTLVALDIL